MLRSRWIASSGSLRRMRSSPARMCLVTSERALWVREVLARVPTTSDRGGQLVSQQLELMACGLDAARIILALRIFQLGPQLRLAIPIFVARLRIEDFARVAE